MPNKYSIIDNKTTFLIVALLLLRNNVHVEQVVALAFHNTKSNHNYNYQPSTLLVTSTRKTCSSSSSSSTTRTRLQVRRGIPTAAAAAAVPIGDDDDYKNDVDNYSDDTITTSILKDETTAIIGILPSKEEEAHYHNNDPHHKINQHHHDDDVVNVNANNNNNNNTNTTSAHVINVVFEDENYFFVSKPPGMICTGGSARDELKSGGVGGNESSGRRDILSFHEVVKAYGLQTYGYQPGLLHRLDKGTSGLMVYAKSLASAKHYLKLQDKKQGSTITKQYLAVVQGVPPYYPKKQQGRIEGGICKSAKDLTGPYIIAKGRKSGKRVLTTYKVLRPVVFKKEDDNDIDDHGLSTTTNTTNNTSTVFTLLSLRLFTGRKHQIRASCRKMKCPIVGDTMYGGPRHPVMLLHAHNIVFTGPGSNKNDAATEYNVTAATPTSWNDFGVQ